MSKVMCVASVTQIGKVLSHARKENEREKVNALIIVSDACEEPPRQLYDLAGALRDVPVFMFQEGDDQYTRTTYAKIADSPKERLLPSTPAAPASWPSC
ncbi:MAG: hypothetical protein JO283_13645 [Bradyrhizobium sp.]|nr:hypothetical protein [Bradyrhizobium sp.]